jgi:peptide/nickel transport system ATP-binding protein
MKTGDPASLLSVEDLRVGVGRGGYRKEAVRGVSFQLGSGEAFGIVGESGSGKTLTVSAISRLLPSAAQVTAGKVLFKGEDLVRASAGRLAEIRGRQMSMVFQDSLTSLNPVMRIGAQVREPLLLHRLADRRHASTAAEQELRRLGIPDPARAMSGYPHEFSGGMRQRAMIAGALIASPELIIADEPTTALDATVQAQIIDIWSKLNRELGVALILVSHDLGVVSEVCDTLAVMYAGRIVEMGPTRSLLGGAKHPYTKALLESMPSSTAARTAKLKAIPGEPPMLGSFPTGCPFHPRCPYRKDVCLADEPRLEPVGDRQVACWVAQERGSLPQQGIEIHLPERGAHPASLVASSAPARERTAEEILVLDKVTCHHLIPNRWPLLPPIRVHALDEVSLAMRRGEVLGIAGESGCGKSTLARCILRLTDIDSGRIVFRGQDITRLGGETLRQVRRHMQPVLQDPYGSLNPRAHVTEIVGEPLAAHGMDRQRRERRVAEVLDLVGLSSRLGSHLPHQLSGGQRQRVGIARAIALNPELIVADEPISALDVSIQAQVLNLFQDLQRRLDLSLVFISHDLRVVRYLSTHVAIMFLGEIIEYGASEDVCGAPLHPYTVALLSSVPEMGERSGGRRIVLSGEPPSPTSPPSGCRFRTRCPHATALCAEIAPELRQMPDGRRVACHFPGVAGVPERAERASLASPVPSQQRK